MKTQTKHSLDITVVFFLSLLSFFAGCAPLNLPPLEEPTENSRMIAAADRLFINGNFEEALVEYEQIFLKSLSTKDKNHALYGLACTRLMLAESDEELAQAIDELHVWDINKGRAHFTENRHLLVMALQQQATLIRQRHKIFSDKETQKDQRIAAQNKKISRLNSELKKLETQLLELEKIEENVQEKRKPQ